MGLEPRKKIRGRLRGLPLIQQCHGLAQRFKLTGAIAALSYVSCHRRVGLTFGQQLNQIFPYIITVHTKSLSRSRNVSYARNSSDLVADSLNFRTVAISR